MVNKCPRLRVKPGSVLAEGVETGLGIGIFDCQACWEAGVSCGGCDGLWEYAKPSLTRDASLLVYDAGVRKVRGGVPLRALSSLVS